LVLGGDGAGDNPARPTEEKADGTRAALKWPQVASGEVQIGYWEKFLRLKSGQALDQAAQGSGGVPIPEGVPKPCGCGPWGHG